MVLPTMEVFTEMAQRYSTPFNGRVPFYNEDDELDENTCAIQIVTRKQSPSENDKAEEPRILSHPDMLSLPAPQQPLLQQVVTAIQSHFFCFNKSFFRGQLNEICSV